MSKSKVWKSTKFEDTLEARGLTDATRIKCAHTLSATNYEKIYALAEFMPENWSNMSRIIDKAMTEFFEGEDIQEQLEEAYERWKQNG